ncbi:uncharacterized protein JCM6883_005396 [Sporobolomyces salmoneus]|uniref:uncharacterized protein n=1 Tax=Sporobolomyces salmoneus TaxID=183962 RepID=UPI00317F9B1B
MAVPTDSIELAQLDPSPAGSSSRPTSKVDPNSFISESSQTPCNSSIVSTDGIDNHLGFSSTGTEQAQLPPVDRGWAAWQFVIAATILEVQIWGYAISYSVILVHLETTEPWSRASLAALSSIGTIQLGLMFFLTVFINNAFRRYPDHARKALYISAAVYPLSLLLSSFATQVWQLIFAQGVVCGLSGAVLYGPVLLWIPEWFVERRGTAAGIVFSGTGLGGAVFPFVLGALLDKVGFVWTVRVWSLVCAVAFSVSLYFIRPRIPPPRFAKGQPRPKWFLINVKALNHPVNYVMIITTLVASMAYFPVSLYLPIYASNLTGSNTFLPNVVAACFNLVSFTASMLIGYVSDKSLALTATTLGVVGGAVALGAWSTADSLVKVFIFAAVFGATTPISSYWGAATREIGGSDPYVSATLMASWGMVRGLASLFSPFLSSALYDPSEARWKSDSYGRFGFQDLIIFVGVLSLVSSLGGVTFGVLKKTAGKRKGGTTPA